MLQAFFGMGFGVSIGVMFVIVLLLPYLAVRSGRNRPGIHRLGLLGRIVALFVLSAGLWVLFFIPFLGFILSIALGFVLSYFFYRFIVQRLNDVQWSPWLVYLCIVPMVNVLFVVLLCIVPPHESETIVLEAG